MNLDWKTVNEMLECAESWVPEARIIGNVRAGDIAKVCRSIIAEGQNTSTNSAMVPCRLWPNPEGNCPVGRGTCYKYTACQVAQHQ